MRLIYKHKPRVVGFSIMSAIFILVVLSMIGLFLINIFMLNRAESNILLQGTRAQFAAKSGVEWGLATVALVPTGPCFSTKNINLSQGGLLGFSVVVSCVKSGTTFTVTAVASQGTIGNFGYVTRTVVGTFG